MTNSSDTCPAAQIGKRIAELSELMDELDGRETRTGKAGKEREASICSRRLEDAFDAFETAMFSLSNVRAGSHDGAAVQIAAAVALNERLEDVDGPERKRCRRAIDRLLYSVIRHLQDRVEADCHEYGIEHLASSACDPWNGVDNVLGVYQEKEEARLRTKVAAE